MKKHITKIAIGVLLTSLFTYSLAFAADDPITWSKGQDGTTITVTVSELENSEETTLLVVPKDTTIAQAFANTALVHYINQTPADSNGVATFKFTAAEDASYDIYSGYATMGIDDDPYKTVIDKSGSGDGGDEPSGDLYIKGDVNNDGKVSAADYGNIIEHILKNIPFYDSTVPDGQPAKVYEYGIQAGDITGDGKVTANDSAYVLDYCLNGIALPTFPAEQ